MYGLKHIPYIYYFFSLIEKQKIPYLKAISGKKFLKKVYFAKEDLGKYYNRTVRTVKIWRYMKRHLSSKIVHG